MYVTVYSFWSFAHQQISLLSIGLNLPSLNHSIFTVKYTIMAIQENKFARDYVQKFENNAHVKAELEVWNLPSLLLIYYVFKFDFCLNSNTVSYNTTYNSTVQLSGMYNILVEKFQIIPKLFTFSLRVKNSSPPTINFDNGGSDDYFCQNCQIDA